MNIIDYQEQIAVFKDFQHILQSAITMKAVFFHDTPLIQDSKGQVYSVWFGYNVWQRYLSVFDNIIVSTRLRTVNNNIGIKNMMLSCGFGVEFKPISNYDKPIDRIIFSKKIHRQIKGALKQADYAIIRLPSIIGNIACNEAIKMDKPYMIECVGCAWDSLWNYSYKGKIIAPLIYYQTKKYIKGAKYVSYVTEKFLQSRYPTNGKFTNCSNVLLQDFDNTVLKKRIERIKDMDSSKKVIIGTIAAIDVRYKGQQYVIEALGKLKKQGITNFEYCVVGDGNSSFLKNIAVRNNVKDQIVFMGRLAHDRIFEWLDNIDIYVQPSRQEGLPRALIEAMSRAVPSFGAKTGGIPELLEEKYIFSNTRHNTDEISNILLSFSKESLQKQADRNFNESKKYDKKIIEDRRKKFLAMYRDNSNKE